MKKNILSLCFLILLAMMLGSPQKVHAIAFCQYGTAVYGYVLKDTSTADFNSGIATARQVGKSAFTIARDSSCLSSNWLEGKQYASEVLVGADDEPQLHTFFGPAAGLQKGDNITQYYYGGGPCCTIGPTCSDQYKVFKYKLCIE